jgi:CheY-like chemotaxis protein
MAPLTILAVDDDPLIMMSTSAMLEDMSHTVFTARSGAEALEILASNKSVDVVITDQAMPGMTGMELAQAIRAQHPKMPIILASGYVDLADEPGNDVLKLNKPYWEHDLVRVLEQAAALLQSPRA